MRRLLNGARGRAFRRRTVRARVARLLVVPSVSLLGLLGFVTVGAVQEAAAARRAQHIEDEVRAPLYQVVRALQEERRAAVAYLAAPTRAREDAFGTRAGETAKAAARLRLDGRRTAATGAGLPDRAADSLTALDGALDAVTKQRRPTRERALLWPQAHGRYTAAITSALTADATLDGTDTRPPARLLQAGELLAQEDAVLTAADLTGTLDTAQQRSFMGTVAARRLMERTATDDLPKDAATAWRTLATGPEYADLRTMEDAVSAAAPGRDAARAAPGGRWRPTCQTLRQDLRVIDSKVTADATRRHDGPYVYGVRAAIAAAVGLGFLALGLSWFVAVRVGRGLAEDLTGLRDNALSIARDELPEAAGEPGTERPSVARGEADNESQNLPEKPPEAPAAPLPADEISQVRAALGSVHRSALDAAAEHAELADRITGVFVNLARRSQVLLHRQLALLDAMERRTQEPAELGDLFRLDHLTTRMHRHAESLIVLSGAAPGRAWRSPVPLVDVVRAAVSEIEDYARIEVRRLPDGALPGAAVADLTHLLAELIENAAQFSPPHTKVRVQGEPVGTGHVLEIEDRGLGMDDEALEEANRRIGDAGAPAPSDRDRLGLFVVSRLAARHGVRVVLRPSVYGGTTAVVLLPHALVHPTGLPVPPAPAPGPVPDGPLERVRAHIGRRTGRALAPPAPPAADSVPGGPEVLPQRVRQRSLAVRLREPPPAAKDLPPEEEPTLSPEQARARMTAYRLGWARGLTEGEP